MVILVLLFFFLSKKRATRLGRVSGGRGRVKKARREVKMVGLGRELALEVFRQVVEIMFGTFTTLMVDHRLNKATKMKWM